MNTISGPYGYAYEFAKSGLCDQDEAIELFCTISAINGIKTNLYDGLLSFSFSLESEDCTILTFSLAPYKCYINEENIRKFLFKHAHFPFEANDFFKDMEKFREGNYLSLRKILDYQDNFIIAIYRFMHMITYHE